MDVEVVGETVDCDAVTLCKFQILEPYKGQRIVFSDFVSGKEIQLLEKKELRDRSVQERQILSISQGVYGGWKTGVEATTVVVIVGNRRKYRTVVRYNGKDMSFSGNDIEWDGKDYGVGFVKYAPHEDIVYAEIDVGGDVEVFGESSN